MSEQIKDGGPAMNAADGGRVVLGQAECCVHGCHCGCCRACKNGSYEPVKYATCDCITAALAAQGQSPATPNAQAVGEVRGIVMHGGGKFAAIEFYGDSLPYRTKLYAAPPASPAVPDGFVEDIQRAERLAVKSKRLNRERMMGLAVLKHFGHLLAAREAKS